MYCWSCGTEGSEGARYCTRCGASLGNGAGNGAGKLAGHPDAGAAPGGPPPPPAGVPSGHGVAPSVQHVPLHWTVRSPLQLRSCPSCGFRGEGIPYFRRAGNLGLLAAATIFTYGVGGLIYWAMKRSDRVCPSCGLGWDRSRPLGEGMEMEVRTGSSEPVALRPSGGPASAGEAAGRAVGSSSAAGLPSGGGFRRLGGVVLGLLGLFFLGIGIIQIEVAAALIGGVVGLSGALSFGWGWKALQRRRQTVLQRMQRDVIRIARAHGGRLTATEVAADMDLSLPAAERILLSLDDGFRVSSDVSDEGILYFDFRELRLGSGEPKG